MFKVLEFMARVLSSEQLERFPFTVPVINFEKNLDFIKNYGVPMGEIAFCPSYIALAIKKLAINLK